MHPFHIPCWNSMLGMGVYSGHIVAMSEQNRPDWDHTWYTVELVVAIEVSRVRIACPV